MLRKSSLLWWWGIKWITRALLYCGQIIWITETGNAHTASRYRHNRLLQSPDMVHEYVLWMWLDVTKQHQLILHIKSKDEAVVNNGLHDDVIKWSSFRVTGHVCGEIHRWPANSHHKGQWRGALVFSLFCAWIKGWVNNREAGDLRRHRAHYDVTVM